MLMRMIEVKSLAGTNFLRPERVIALQTSPTGTCVIVLDNGATVQSSETTKDVAAKIEAALAAQPL